jgi:aspartyl protease family protein
MKNLLFYLLISFSLSCGSSILKATKVLNGNSFELSNGVRVTLANVEENAENIKILERYLIGNILLYDDANEEIKSFSSDNIIAWVYNSDGDCVNSLLTRISEITIDKIPTVKVNKSDNTESNVSVVKYQEESGVLHIPVLINGVEMYFVFDTGAGLISISQDVADDLYRQGQLNEKDFVGKGLFSDANGDITEGTIINLSTVTIGNRELHNVQACVSQGQNAPLLFGQSALQKFGKVSIDYNRNEITFE